MSGSDYRRTLSDGVNVVDALVKEIDAKEACGAKGLDSGVNLFQMPAQGALPVINTKEGLGGDTRHLRLVRTLLSQSLKQLDIQRHLHGLLPDLEGLRDGGAIQCVGEGGGFFDAGCRGDRGKVFATLYIEKCELDGQLRRHEFLEGDKASGQQASGLLFDDSDHPGPTRMSQSHFKQVYTIKGFVPDDA